MKAYVSKFAEKIAAVPGGRRFLAAALINPRVRCVAVLKSGRRVVLTAVHGEHKRGSGAAPGANV